MNASIIAVALQIVVSVVVVIWARAKVRSALGEGEAIEKVRREVGALIIELDASADRNVTVIEDRISQLKELVAEADRRVALLAQEKGRRQSENAVYDRLGRVREPERVQGSLFSEAPRPASRASEPEARAGAAQAAAQPAQGSSAPSQGPAAPDRAAERPPERTAALDRERPAERSPERPPEPSVPFIRFSDKPLAVEEPFADKVAALYRRGFSSDIIAARLGATIAEVDLAIASSPPERSS